MYCKKNIFIFLFKLSKCGTIKNNLFLEGKLQILYIASFFAIVYVPVRTEINKIDVKINIVPKIIVVDPNKIFKKSELN